MTLLPGAERDARKHPMLRKAIALCLLATCSLTANETGWRNWKSAAGTEIEGRVVEWVPCPRFEESGVVMETSDGRKLTVSYDGEITTLKLEDIKPEDGAGGVTVKPGVTHHGYRLVHDAGDRSELATKLAEDELQLRLDVGRDSFCVIDMELMELAKKPE